MSDATYKCPHCGQVFEGAAEDAGLDAECPSCGKAFRLEPEVAVVSTARPNGFQCYLGIFKRYFDFRGRMPRREFWWAFLFQILASFVVGVVDGLFFGEYDDNQYLLVGIFGLATAVPFFAAHARRLHDTGKSAWWIPLILLPPINIAYFVWLGTAGDKGANRFGPSPRGRL
ncbi:MAG: DUF805 domain-containing protein [Kiritimatiellae bacterium]|nr:DUF805 domain-containing protein [Kiritimatiellia bacterium]